MPPSLSLPPQPHIIPLCLAAKYVPRGHVFEMFVKHLKHFHVFANMFMFTNPLGEAQGKIYKTWKCLGNVWKFLEKEKNLASTRKKEKLMFLCACFWAHKDQPWAIDCMLICLLANMCQGCTHRGVSSQLKSVDLANKWLCLEPQKNTKSV